MCPCSHESWSPCLAMKDIPYMGRWESILYGAPFHHPPWKATPVLLHHPVNNPIFSFIGSEMHSRQNCMVLITPLSGDLRPLIHVQVNRDWLKIYPVKLFKNTNKERFIFRQSFRGDSRACAYSLVLSLHGA